jgi:hypothetical protein
MFRRSAIALALAALGSSPVWGADADLQALRAEITQMKKSYEERLAALEARLATAEAKAAPVPAPAPAAAAVASAPAAPASESSFNPAISVVLAGTYVRLSQDPEAYAIGGFMPTGGEVAPPRRSFGLGESELGIAANIDPTLRGQLTVALAPEGGADVEEAFVRALALGNGLGLQAGRFLSGIGYMNSQHAHAWDFADAPLAYKAMLGGQMKTDGVQLKWLAPTDFFLELGAELGAGGAFPSTDRNRNGATVAAAFARVGGDAGDTASWRAGLSWLGTSPRERTYEDVDAAGKAVSNAFSGRSRTWLADAVWKWQPPGGQSLVLQTEVFHRRETGRLAFDVGGAGLEDGYAASQSGGYGQAVWQFQPRWRLGLRHDRLASGTPAIGLIDTGVLTAADFPLLAGYTPTRNSVMVDFSPSEFSRWRLQLARDRSRSDAVDNQLWLQYVVSMGAHGAHQY